jgi:(R,R)-butanediol dehydrogenase / meso-butanediol dehydrogenase / diacetyl reductase
VERGDLPVGGLISRVVPMAEAKAAFDALAAGGGVLKVLVDVQSGAGR